MVVLKDGPFGPAVRHEVDDAVFALTIEVDWLEGHLPANAVRCAFDAQRADGIPQAERTKCGDCRLCLDSDGPDAGVVK